MTVHRCKLIRRLLPVVLLSLLAVRPAVAVDRGETVVDRSVPLEEISTEFELCDGPAWDGNWALYLPDVKAQKLYRYLPARKQLQVVLPESGRISAAFYQSGQLYLSDNANARITRLEDKTQQVVTSEDSEARPARRPNDLVVDPLGNVYYTLTAAQQVIHVDPQGKRQVAIDGIDSPNGITLSPDASVLYVASYRPKKILAFPLAGPGVVGEGREFAVMDDGPELGADGMTIDRAGNVYCAGATDVWIWSPDGQLLDRIRTPTRPINCAFGDGDMRSLYITCFGGLYKQRMRICGKSPDPPALSELQPDNPDRPSTAILDGVTASIDVPYATYGTRKVLADIFVPATGKAANPAILVVHGGGWLNGDKTKFRALAVELARRGYVTAAIEYRLGGEARFPAGIQDCKAAVRFLRANAAKYRIDPERIGAVGGSAGGHLVGLMATAGNEPALEGDGGCPDQSSRLQAAIVMAGPLQMTTGSVAERSRNQPDKSNSNKWLGATIDEAPELYELADAYLKISKSSAPLLFMVGEHDQPERNEPARMKLREAEVWTGLKVYPNGNHGCWNRLPWFSTMAQDMDEFFQQQFGIDPPVKSVIEP